MTLAFAVTDDQLHPLPVALGAAVHEALPCEVEGVYSGLRSYGDKLLRLDLHLERMRANLATLSATPALDDAAWERALREALARQRAADPDRDARFRFDTLVAARPTPAGPCRAFVAVAAFDPPSPDLVAGCAAFTLSPLRRRDPGVKRLDSIAHRRGATAAYEALLHDGDDLLECSSSNFCAVMRGTLVTAREGVLAGVTRRLVLELARGLGLPSEERPPRRGEIAQLDEAFLTSCSREVVPIARIGDHVVGPPGPVTRALLAAYRTYVGTHAR